MFQFVSHVAEDGGTQFQLVDHFRRAARERLQKHPARRKNILVRRGNPKADQRRALLALYVVMGQVNGDFAALHSNLSDVRGFHSQVFHHA